MIVTIEKEFEECQINQSKFGQEYEYEMKCGYIDLYGYVSVNVVDCFIQCEEATVNNLVKISSSLIAKSSINPDQMIHQFMKTKKSDVLFDSPTRILQYKLERFRSEGSVIKFSFLKEVKKIKIRLRLEFYKCHTDLAKL